MRARILPYQHFAYGITRSVWVVWYLCTEVGDAEVGEAADPGQRDEHQ